MCPDNKMMNAYRAPTPTSTVGGISAEADDRTYNNVEREGELVTNYRRSSDMTSNRRSSYMSATFDLDGRARTYASPNACPDDPHNVEAGHGYSVTGIELFSDLVMVVAIHVVAVPLEDADVLLNNIPWYIIRVFHLWLIWHSSMIAFHLSHLFEDADNAIHYVVVLAYMILVMLLSQHYRTGDNWGALVINMVVRSFEVIVFAVQVNREPPMHFDPARLAILRMIPKSMAPNFVVTELLPLSLALIFQVDGQPRMSLVWLSIVLAIAQRTYGAWKVDVLQRNSIEKPVQVFDPHLMKERYELIALIFIGELAFAAAGPSDDWNSIGYCILAMLAAFGCFLLCFTARHPQVLAITEFWSRSGVHVMTGQHFYLGLFIAIPAIAAGYLHIANSMEMVKEEGNAGDTCEPTSSALLTMSSITFMIFSSLVHSMTQSKRETRMKQWQLVVVRFSAAGVCASLYFLPAWAACAGAYPVATFTVPLLFFFSACVEVWGLQEKGYSFLERHKRQTTVQRVKPLQKGGSSKSLGLNYVPSVEDGTMA